MRPSETTSPSARTRVGLSGPNGSQWSVPKRLTNATERKPRIHPKEAGHSIEDLPSLSQQATQSDNLNAAEILKSLGLQVSGTGESAGVWFVGTSEQTEDEGSDFNMAVEATETASGDSGGGKTRQ